MSSILMWANLLRSARHDGAVDQGRQDRHHVDAAVALPIRRPDCDQRAEVPFQPDRLVPARRQMSKVTQWHSCQARLASRTKPEAVDPRCEVHAGYRKRVQWDRSTSSADKGLVSCAG